MDEGHTVYLYRIETTNSGGPITDGRLHARRQNRRGLATATKSTAATESSARNAKTPSSASDDYRRPIIISPAIVGVRVIHNRKPDNPNRTQ